jgi:hypothetical protein
MRFDELAVHAGNIHLAQIDAGARMPLQPGDDGQQPRPFARPVRAPQRPLRQPGQQLRLASRRQFEQGRSGSARAACRSAPARRRGCRSRPRAARRWRRTDGAGTRASRSGSAAWRAVRRSRRAPRRSGRPSPAELGAFSVRRRGNSGSPVTTLAQQFAALPQLLHLGAQQPAGRVQLIRAARAFSARYSSIDRLRSFEVAAFLVVHEADAGDEGFDDVDLLQRRDDQQLQVELLRTGAGRTAPTRPSRARRPRR